MGSAVFMSAMKNAGAVLLGIAALLAILFLAGFLLEGAAYVSVIVLPYLSKIAVIATAICVIILLPLALFRATRIASFWGFFIASYIFGLDVWLYGFVMTYALWGGLAVFIGLCMFGVGVVPLGIIAAALHGMWEPVAELVFGAVITYAARFFALYLAKKIDEAAYA
jgi:hypothetical protein